MSEESRERFLRAIAARVEPERVEEVHLFPALRQGSRETGVAVITVRLAVEDDALADPATSAASAASAASAETAATDDAPSPALDAPPTIHADAPRRIAERLTVLRAHYRLTLKGPARGTWEIGVTEEADAPARTVDEVVRGVHERSPAGDEPEHLTGDAFRAAVVGSPGAPLR